MTAALALLSLAAAGGASPAVHVDAEEVQYLYRERKVIFLGKPLVRLTREDAVLTCRRLEAENDDRGAIEKAVCTGDVRLVRGGRVVTCERATFDSPAARVVCTGSPVLRDGDSVVRGDTLTYDLVEDRVTLSRARGTVVPAEGQLAPRPAEGSR